jgi:hypothetical protein
VKKYYTTCYYHYHHYQFNDNERSLSGTSRRVIPAWLKRKVVSLLFISCGLSWPAYTFKTKNKGPDNPTCQLLPTSSKRKVKIAWGKQEREKRRLRIGAEQVVCGRLSTSD